LTSYVADPILSEEDVSRKRPEVSQAVDADLVFDPFELKFEVSAELQDQEPSHEGSIYRWRPAEFRQACPVSRELRRRFDEVIIHTGQHYDYEMDKIFFDDMGIPAPDYHLALDRGATATRQVRC